MSIHEAISMVSEWSDLEGITIDNINEMGAFMGLIRASSEDFRNEDIGEHAFEDRIEEISLAIFQLGRAVGRSNVLELK